MPPTQRTRPPTHPPINRRVRLATVEARRQKLVDEQRPDRAALRAAGLCMSSRSANIVQQQANLNDVKSHAKRPLKFAEAIPIADVMYPGGRRRDTGTSALVAPSTSIHPPPTADPLRLNPTESLNLRWVDRPGVGPARTSPPRTRVPNVDVLGQHPNEAAAAFVEEKAKAPGRRGKVPAAYRPEGEYRPVAAGVSSGDGRPNTRHLRNVSTVNPLTGQPVIAHRAPVEPPSTEPRALEGTDAAVAPPPDDLTAANDAPIPSFDIFGRRRPAWASQPPASRGTRALSAQTYVDPSISEAAAPPGRLGALGLRSVEEHYAKVMRRVDGSRSAELAAVNANNRSVENNHRRCQVTLPKDRTGLVWGTEDRSATNCTSVRRRKPADLGGEGVVLGQDRQPFATPRPLQCDAWAPTSIRHVAPVEVVPDNAHAQQAGPALSVKGGASRRAASAGSGGGADGDRRSTATGAILRTAPFVRALLRRSGGWGIRPLRIALRAMDTDGDGLVTVREARRAVDSLGPDTTDEDGETLRRAGATQAIPHGKVCFPQLLDALRGPPPSAARDATMVAAYRGIQEVLSAGSMNPGSSAPTVTLADLCRLFRPEAHAGYDAHDRSSPRRLQQAFARLWGPQTKPTSVVTQDHFVYFFRDVSVGIVADRTFTAMMTRLFVQQQTNLRRP